MTNIISAKNITRFVFVAFVLSIIYAAVCLVMAPIDLPEPDMPGMVKYDYFIMLLTCAFGAVAMLLPRLLTQLLKISIPNAMVIVYALFIFCGICCGNVLNFYEAVPHWDTLLHTISGALLCLLGFSLVVSFDKAKTFASNPAMIAVFAFSFAAAVGVFWEIAEFALDLAFGSNAQRFRTFDGEILVGQAALMDTMKDYIFNSIGAAAYAFYGYKSIKKGGATFQNWLLKRVEE